MRRHRFLFAAFTTLALTATGALLLSAGSTAAQSKSQQLFQKLLLADERTTPAIKRLLADSRGFVEPRIEFSDLTADGRSDAVVLVETGGAAGAVALYLFSTDGRPADSQLRAVYRSQRLYRASAELAAGTLLLRSPRYAEGDDICCPAKIVERTYAWSAGQRTMSQRSSEELPGPTGAPAAPAPPAEPAPPTATAPPPGA